MLNSTVSTTTSMRVQLKLIRAVCQSWHCNTQLVDSMGDLNKAALIIQFLISAALVA